MINSKRGEKKKEKKEKRKEGKKAAPTTIYRIVHLAEAVGFGIGNSLVCKCTAWV